MVEAAYRHHGLDARYLNCEVTPGGARGCRRGRPRDGLGRLQLLAAAQGRRHRPPRRPRALGRGDRCGQHRRRHRRRAGRPQHRRPGLRRVAAHGRRPGRARGRRARRRGSGPRGRRRDGARRRGIRHRRQPRPRPRRGARPRRHRRHRGARDVRAWDHTFAVPERRRRPRQRHLGRLRRRRGAGRRRPRQPAGRASWWPTSSSRRRARPCCGPRPSAGPAPSTASGMLVGQGALAVRHWTGVEPDREVMRAAAARALGL